MRQSFILVFCLVLLNGNAQYYYYDIVYMNHWGDWMKSYVKNKVKIIEARGYDAYGVQNKEFSEVYELDPLQKVICIRSLNGNLLNKTCHYFDNELRLKKTTDTSGSTISQTTYEWDNSLNILKIKNIVNDTLQQIHQTEEHIWHFRSGNIPERMYRILNHSDTSEVRFQADDSGNVSDEILYKKGKRDQVIYYYYDKQNRLTDIVKYNSRLKRLLPEFIFEYDNNNRITQKLNLLPDRQMKYLIWRYQYDAQGLKVKESLYNSKKELTGSITYVYNFY